ncbi:pilus assembly protein [Marinobacter zhejiangensis]|uniref:Type IV pilus assembly protein PilY1 n=1 Tax=Marinobacter zhejiangensis TaxID=488535 RepID=A0A1I4S7C4_9GAMM|nr:PilC/PilY family type IV pilus protein [Marinobacter zhejiangensis]SFM60408.1 type IV pilus assembly protein PilY1 [Marinobacter zhejiangensis]
MSNQLKSVAYSGLLALAGLSGTLQADDTEIFFNTDATEIRPNILFVLDNSGSMDAEVTTTSSYDNTQSYTGDYSDDYIYFIERWNGDDYLVPVAKSRNKCSDLLTRLSQSGYVTEYRMAMWRNSNRSNTLRWRTANAFYDDTGNILECYADRGVHGETSGAADKYARNHSRQWGSSSQEINWADIGRSDIYSANYVNWFTDHRVSETRTRLQIMQSVAAGMADSLSGVNIGLMAFNTDDRQRQGGRVLVPIANVDDNRTAFKAAVNALDHETWTPLSETLFGASRYFQGDAPFLDTNPVTGTVDEEGNYISPVQYECQSNNVILLTDGTPTYDARLSGTYNEEEDGASRTTIQGVVGNCSGNCLDEIAGYMYSTGMDAGFNENITVKTYTVGFDQEVDATLLSGAASLGGGEYYTANNTESLETAFKNIVREVLAVNTTFVAPGVAVNTFNRLNHLDALYFSVFQPDVATRWDGNLKRYRLGADGIVYDANDLAAVESNTGFFKGTAQSFWSDEADGPNVSMGGASNEQPDDNSTRNVYTYFSGGNSDLTAATNSVDVANISNLTKTMFGNANMTDAEHQKLINWTRGLDVEDEDGDSLTSDARKYIADPLHSVPHLVIFGGTADAPDTTVFFGDNQGFIHAIDGGTGASYFSFIPSELLANQAGLLANQDDVTSHIYGMDGSVVSWSHDENFDNQINADDGDHVYIYGGMRRGGRSYYALDVTNRTSPTMLWQIQGGAGDFTELGETWSKPVKTKIQIQNAVKDVLIFAGGYDNQQDNVTVRTADTVGRALYIVDATTGALLWWAGPTGSGANLELADMRFSIPSAPKVLDVSGDRLANQIYVGDMGGQIWRFDITNGNQASSLITAGVIADLAGDDAASNRRFYHAPDLFGLNVGGSRYLGMVIGSGYQAHPLDKIIDDRIYMIRIADVTESPKDPNDVTQVLYTKLTESDLYDTTDNLIGQGNAAEVATAQTALAAADGWYIRLVRDGEKVLSTSQTVNGQTFITTYEPSPNLTSCYPSAGQSRLYHIYVKDGQPVINYDGVGESDELTTPDREVALSTLGLPPDPQRMRVDGKDIVCVGAECMPVDTLTGVVETYWYEE